MTIADVDHAQWAAILRTAHITDPDDDVTVTNLNAQLSRMADRRGWDAETVGRMRRRLGDAIGGGDDD